MLPRIAAVAHALCDRDEVKVPNWVWRHRSRRHIMMGGQRATNTPWTRLVQAEAPTACSYHRVWFDPASIEDHRVHGFRDHPATEESDTSGSSNSSTTLRKNPVGFDAP